MKIRVLPNAEVDLEIGSDFYESQSAGLGEYFLSCLISDIESLKLFAGIHAKEFGFHRLVAKRFPFAIYYLVEADTIDIHAVLDCRQLPQATESRLGDERSQ